MLMLTSFFLNFGNFKHQFSKCAGSSLEYWDTCSNMIKYKKDIVSSTLEL